MLLTLTTTVEPATDLGFLLHKHPEKVQTFPVSAGTAHVFYPRADAGECTAALLLDLDPLALSRESPSGNGWVNDRPYAAGSLLAVALGAVFGSALKGRCVQRPELAETAIPLVARLPTQRRLGLKRSLALREYALGLEALERLARDEPLWRVHECVFAVLALESEPVDPRL